LAGKFDGLNGLRLPDAGGLVEVAHSGQMTKNGLIKCRFHKDKNMRNLYNVIAKMLRVIPQEETSLIGSLIKIQTLLEYSAPETQTFWWNECADLLNMEVPNISEFWQKKLSEIFAGKKSNTQ